MLGAGTSIVRKTNTMKKIQCKNKQTKNGHMFGKIQCFFKILYIHIHKNTGEHIAYSLMIELQKLFLHFAAFAKIVMFYFY